MKDVPWAALSACEAPRAASNWSSASFDVFLHENEYGEETESIEMISNDRN